MGFTIRTAKLMGDLVLTFDTDWAPDFVIQDTLSMLGDIPATFFVTDNISGSMLKGIPTIERGIHPNFMPGSSHGITRYQVLETVLRLVPDAKIVRAHYLFQDSTVLDLYVENGLQTDMSLLQYQNPQPKPFRYWNNLLRMPFNFEDDIACLRGEVLSQCTWWNTIPTLVCNFHPIHIYLNSGSMEGYFHLRQSGSLSRLKASDIDPFVTRTSFGVRDILNSLLNQLKSGDRSVVSVSECIDRNGVEDWAHAVKTQLTTQRSP